VSVRTDGKFAVAHVSVPGYPKIWRSQWTLLGSTTGGWHVLAVVLDQARQLQCKAPAAVMQTLAGGCIRDVASPAATIEGPTASRPATADELAAISSVARRVVFQGHDSCVTYVARVSTLDPRYARAAYELHKPYTNCHIGNGVSIYMRTTAGGWRHLADASDPFTCDSGPPGVVRTLFGMCAIYFPR